MNRVQLLKSQLTSNQTSGDFFGHVPLAPLDPILGTAVLYKADKDPRKVDLGIGAYRTEEGKPYVFNVIKEAEALVHKDLLSGDITKCNKEYQPSEGNAQFLELSKQVVFGQELYGSLSKRVASTQALGGTGALRVCADFLKIYYPDCTIYLPSPTWGNHNQIFKRVGLKIDTYPYYNKKTRGFDAEGMLEKLASLPPKSIVLLHTCAHNPTGVDPTPDQWRYICQVMKMKNHFPIFDTAYQGFASGDIHKDAFSLRYFAEEGFKMIVTQSYSKTMGLYGERCGCFHLLCENENTAKNTLSQLKLVIRANWSNPPVHTMKLALKILSDKNLYERWLNELKEVAGRIIKMRTLLRNELERLKVPGDWSNITSQIGMFSFTGLSEKQSTLMLEKHHVYMLKNGRISMAGLNTKNVGYVAEAMKKSIEEAQ